jgi:hypothetical protein
MKRRRLAPAFLGLAVLLVFPGPALAAVEDLTSWIPASYPGDGSIFAQPGFWDVSPSGTEVVQTANGAPTFFISPTSALDQRITLSFTAPLVADDDFFGVALGLGSAIGNPTDDYLLLDWRKQDQLIDWFGGGGAVLGVTGLAVSRVTGVPAWDELWGHLDQPETPGGQVTELARGTTLGSTGWVAGTTYGFEIEYTATSLRVWVDGSLEFDLAGSFPSGGFGLYDFSLAGLRAGSITFTPLNPPPAVTGSGAPDVSDFEGEVGATGGGFTDPDGDPLTLDCTGLCSGFTDNGDGTWQWSQLLVEGPAASSVTVTASDGLETATDTFSVTVANRPPVIVAATILGGSHHLTDPLAVTADFTDAGVLDTHTAVFDWGDGTSSAAAVDEIPGSGTASASHTYSDPGFYLVTVTVEDDDGDSDQAVLGEIFVFDPDTFVTGGGWVASPAGALIADRTHTGKATFGFVVRYGKDGSVRGNLQFALHNRLSLHAQGFDYLLINDGVAEFSGWGRINGDGGYRFLVVATDERLAGTDDDLFWITITQGGATIYDGSFYPADGLPTRGRGIQVHT